MAAHTPGPWTLGFADEKRAFVNAKGVTVCKCDRGGDEGESLADPRANARLIAAAPEMLDELRDLAALSDETIDEGDPAILGGFRDAAQRLIEKINGR